MLLQVLAGLTPPPGGGVRVDEENMNRGQAGGGEGERGGAVSRTIHTVLIRLLLNPTQSTAAHLPCLSLLPLLQSTQA